ncbi:MAG: DUF6350 family protein [Candidatus Nanopelagicales bacterium]|nr:DUF6350 family protein [Candidatus Nanopelagicales bacterium]
MGSALRIAAMTRAGPDVPRLLVPVLAAAWAAVVGVLATALLLLAGGAAAGDLAGPSGLAWLASHHSRILTPDGGITLLPLGMMVIPVLAVRRATRWLICRSTGSRTRLCAPALGLYVTAAVMVAAVVDVSGFRASAVSALVMSTAVAAVAGFWGFRKQSDTPLALPGSVAGVAVAFAFAVAVGAVLVAGSLAASAPAIVDARQSAQMGAAESIGLMILQVAYLPNAVLWGAAYAAGPGIAVGGSNVLSPYVGVTASAPNLPLLDSLPPTSPAWTALLPILIAVGGALAGMTAHRRCGCASLTHRLGRAAILGGGTAAVWFVAGSLAGGALGGGRLEWIGPAPGTALASGALVGLGAVVWALLPTLVSDARPMAQDVGTRIGAGLTKRQARRRPEPTSAEPPARTRAGPPVRTP